MTEDQRGTLMAVQCAVILVPVSIIELIYAVSVAELFDLKGQQLWLFAPPAVICAIPLIAIWRLALLYTFGGAERLSSASAPWWFIATAGAGVPLIGISAWLIDTTLGGLLSDSARAFWLGQDNDEFGIRFAAVTAVWALRNAVFTSPLLITLAHLWWEKSRIHAL